MPGARDRIQQCSSQASRFDPKCAGLWELLLKDIQKKIGTRFIDFVKEYYHERKSIRTSTTLQTCARARSKALLDSGFWNPTIRGLEGDWKGSIIHGLHQEDYSMCCYINDQPNDYGVDIFPTACRNRHIDFDKSVHNAESICQFL